MGGPTLLRWLFLAFIALYAVGLIVEVAHFVIGHAPVICVSLLCGAALVWGLVWRPKATVKVAAVLLYATMAFRLFVGAR